MNKGASGTVWEHLEELRWRILRSFIAVVLFAIPAGIFWKEFYRFFIVLSNSTGQFRVVYTAPADPVIFSVKLAIFIGIILSFPYIFYQLWSFIAPGLYKNERRNILTVTITSTALFLCGIGFVYFVLPFILSFLSGFAEGTAAPVFRVQEYFSFLIKMALAFGIVFEMPLLTFLCSRAGLLTPSMMISSGRYVIVGSFILAALLTPPDIISQLIMVVPLIVLYGISIVVSGMANKN